ncbi:WbuC family cupin fold metalloprotein [Rhodoflexus caldus]|uniref:WbuC family cupin fold metalloprotein n=1 Tax=Rhodoflexus caldus TaxID=2891236 RepID=UPI002029F1A1|nr:WbuC family cupin fold metalloprotein [Rhodoflexus caldus]
MITINRALIQSLSQKAKASPRLRANHNFHTDLADPINRMLNAMEPGTYVQPHKHENPDKREAFIVLSGEVAVITFHNDGTPHECRILTAGGECMGVEIPAGVFHTLVVLKSGTVCYELKDGPYDVLTDKQFAAWAPPEGNADCEAYLNGLLQWINSIK